MVNKTGPKNTVENMKHFKIQLIFNDPKNTAAVSSTQQKYRFLKFKTQKNTPLIPVCKYAKSTPWGKYLCLPTWASNGWFLKLL